MHLRKMLLRFRQAASGVSNVIVIILSLVILTVVFANVVLWNYEMNQLDWDRTKEDLEITRVIPALNSPWSPTTSEYAVNMGSLINGSYASTQRAGDSFETFKEGEEQRIDINGTFAIDLSTYPLSSIRSIEVQLVYRASDTGETLRLEAYNWTDLVYDDAGFNTTGGHIPTGGWDIYSVNLTEKWSSYVSLSGSMYIRLQDSVVDANPTTIDIDFLAVRALIDGAELTFRYTGSVTCHLISIWVNNSTYHERHSASIYINAGEALVYIDSELNLPEEPYIVKAVTERGNVFVYPAN